MASIIKSAANALDKSPAEFLMFLKTDLPYRICNTLIRRYTAKMDFEAVAAVKKFRESLPVPTGSTKAVKKGKTIDTKKYPAKVTVMIAPTVAEEVSSLVYGALRSIGKIQSHVENGSSSGYVVYMTKDNAEVVQSKLKNTKGITVTVGSATAAVNTPASAAGKK